MIGSGWVLTHNLPNRYDVYFGDETTYLYSGLTYTFPPDSYLAQWGSLYAAWYGVLHKLIPNVLQVFYLNWQLLIILTGVLLFLYLFLRRSGFLVSLFCAVLFQFSTLNVLLDPRISAFTLCLLLGGLCALQAWHWKPQNVMMLTALVALVCAYVRPEFYISMIIAGVIGIGMSFYPSMRSGRIWLKTAGVVLFVLAMHWFFGKPLSGSNRSYDAFVQHFFINYQSWHHQPLDKPIVQQFAWFEQIFGKDVKSMPAAFMVHPDLVIHHLWTNLQNTILAELHSLWNIFFETPLTSLNSPYRKWILGALAAFVVFGLIDWRETYRQVVRRIRCFTTKELALLILLLPSFVSVILVFPRSHYLYFHAFGMLVFVAFLLTSIQLRRSVNQSPVWVGSLLMVLVGWVVYQYSQRLQAFSTPTAHTIQFVESLPVKGPVTSLEREWYRVFLYEPERIPKWVRVEQYIPNTDFARFVTENNVNFILMTRDMQKYFANDQGFSDFLSQANSVGFVRLETPEPSGYLLIQQSLLNKGNLALDN